MHKMKFKVVICRKGETLTVEVETGTLCSTQGYPAWPL